MKYYLASFLFGSTLLFISCAEDTGMVKATFFEAEAVYGNLDDIRSQPINSSVRAISNPGKVYVSDNLILIGEEESGIHVIDNTNISAPKTINFINIPGNREFFVRGEHLFAESYYDVLKLDISDPENVQLAGRARNVFNQEFVDGSGDALLGFTFKEVTREVDENSNLFREISNDHMVHYDFARNIIPQSAVPASFSGNSNQSNGTVNRINYHKGHVYVLGRFDISIIVDNQSFDQVFKIENVGEEMETVFPYEDKLFIGSRSSMEIFDLSVATQPRHQYRFDHATSCDPVLPKNGAAYISLRTAEFSDCPGNINALIVMNINDMENPRQVDEIRMNSPYGMSLIEEVLFVGEGDHGLTMFDASDPLKLVRIKNDPSIKAYDIIQHPSRSELVLVAGSRGVQQFKFDSLLGFELQSEIDF